MKRAALGLLALAGAGAVSSGCASNSNSQEQAWQRATDALAANLPAFIAGETAIEAQFSTHRSTPKLIAAITLQRHRAERLRVQAEHLPASTASERLGARMLAKAFSRYRTAYDDYRAGLRQHTPALLVSGDREEQSGFTLLAKARQKIETGQPSNGFEAELHDYATAVQQVHPLEATAVNLGNQFFLDLNKPNASVATLREDARRARDANRRAAARLGALTQPSDERLAAIAADYTHGYRMLAEAYDDYLRGLSGEGQGKLRQGDTVRSRGYATIDRANRRLVKLAKELNK
jgi:hypothetical protein